MLVLEIILAICGISTVLLVGGLVPFILFCMAEG